jgi:Iron-containing redox enzyme
MPTPAPTRPDTASSRLRRKIDLVTPPFALACGRVFTHPRISDVLPEYLIRTYLIIRTTTPLMEAAIARATDLAGNDPVAAGVVPYLAQHVEEERHHDEWLLEDLELMGVPPDAVVNRIPSPTIAQLAGSQYYWVLHVHPVAFLGYLAFMEGFPPSTTLIEDLIDRTGFPRAAFRTLFEHGDLDVGHRDELDRVIDGLPLTTEQETLLGLSAISTAQLLPTTLEEVLEDMA